MEKEEGKEETAVSADSPMNAEAIKALNERLGITDRDALFNSHELKSVDELLENSRREFERFSKEISSKKEEVEKAETEMKTAVANSGTACVSKSLDSINNFETTIRTMENLVTTGESIMQRIYDAIGQTDLVDPDIIESAAKIIEAVRISLADVMAYHTSKFKMEFDYRRSVEMENIKQSHRLEMEERKSENRLKEIRLKQELKDEAERAKAIPSEGGEVQSDAAVQSWNQSHVMEMMRSILNAPQNP